MTKKKIAILGGGMSALSAAYQLTRTPELRDQHDVTLYTIGWRLGGKAASGRDALGRNLEHGLHVWFGCYDNMFSTIQDVYAKWKRPEGCPLQHWTDVAKPQPFTPIGVKASDGTWSYFPLTWPANDGTPGDGRLNMTPRELISTLYNLFKIVVDDAAAEIRLHAGEVTQASSPLTPLDTLAQTVTGRFEAFLAREVDRAKALLLRSKQVPLPFDSKVEAVRLWVKALATDAAMPAADAARSLLDLHRQAQADFERLIANTSPTAIPAGSAIALKLQIVLELFDIAGAAFAGYLFDLIIPNRPFESLDGEDFRAWLLRHGADRRYVESGTIVRILYDTMFQYVEGDVERPSYAAGSALGVIGRLIGTYKGMMMWDIQAGMGEAVVAPIYDVLRDNGVEFRFFRKVSKLALSSDGSNVAAVQLERQADIRQGEYQPTLIKDNLRVWPSEPLWDQLVDGERLKAAGVNFESHWCPEPPVATETLQLGTDFDCIVLAIAMGAYKPLNAEDSMCKELIDKSNRFSDFVNKMGLVPSQGLQLWCNRTLAELGWSSAKPATVGGPEYLNIWADMSQVLPFEFWPEGQAPVSLHYLTGTLATTLYREPSTNREVPAQAQAQLRAAAIDWLSHSAQAIWPNACDGHDFRYEFLVDPANGSGVARFDAQFLRANIDPTECCIGSAAGTTQFRLLPHEAGFDNLFLAGEATRQGFNTTTIEGAVMSGMAASRAICGQPEKIVGYDFLRIKASEHAEQV